MIHKQSALLLFARLCLPFVSFSCAAMKEAEERGRSRDGWWRRGVDRDAAKAT